MSFWWVKWSAQPTGMKTRRTLSQLAKTMARIDAVQVGSFLTGRSGTKSSVCRARHQLAAHKNEKRAREREREWDAQDVP